MLKANIDLETVGGRIEFYRKTAGKTQNDLSAETGLDRSTIIRMENGKSFCSLSCCNKIAEALNIRPEQLYDDYLLFINSDYGQSIRSLRKKLGLTQSEFAKRISTTRKAVGSWERQKTIPIRDNYFKIQQLTS